MLKLGVPVVLPTQLHNILQAILAASQQLKQHKKCWERDGGWKNPILIRGLESWRIIDCTESADCAKNKKKPTLIYLYVVGIQVVFLTSLLQNLLMGEFKSALHEETLVGVLNTYTSMTRQVQYLIPLLLWKSQQIFWIGPPYLEIHQLML